MRRRRSRYPLTGRSLWLTTPGSTACTSSGTTWARPSRKAQAWLAAHQRDAGAGRESEVEARRVARVGDNGSERRKPGRRRRGPSGAICCARRMSSGARHGARCSRTRRRSLPLRRVRSDSAVGIAELDAHEKAVQLLTRAAERCRSGAPGFCVASTKKGFRQWAAFAILGDLIFLHGFEQRALGLGRGAIDFIGEHQLREYRPGGESESVPFSRSYTEIPRMSAGSRSLVNCTRWKSRPMIRASAWASKVLPTPGTSSMSRWPRAIIQATAMRMARSLPRMMSPAWETTSLSARTRVSSPLMRASLDRKAVTGLSRFGFRGAAAVAR